MGTINRAVFNDEPVQSEVSSSDLQIVVLKNSFLENIDVVCLPQHPLQFMVADIYTVVVEGSLKVYGTVIMIEVNPKNVTLFSVNRTTSLYRARLVAHGYIWISVQKYCI